MTPEADIEQPTQKDRFSREGYMIFRGLLSPKEVSMLSSICDEVIEMASKNSSDLFCNYYLKHRTDQGALYDLYQRFPAFRRIAEHPGILDAIKEIYSDEFYLFENSLVYKPQGAQNEVPWHQDYMYMINDPDKVVVWVPVDNVTEENGCMYAIPGSHLSRTLPWYEEKGETHAKRTKGTFVDEQKAVPLTMNAGDVLVFHQFLLHSSKRVSGHLKRRAYRFAVKSLDNSYVPRSTPIVLSARKDGKLLMAFKSEEEKIKNPISKTLKYIGKKVQRLGAKIESLL